MSYTFPVNYIDRIYSAVYRLMHKKGLTVLNSVFQCEELFADFADFSDSHFNIFPLFGCGVGVGTEVVPCISDHQECSPKIIHLFSSFFFQKTEFHSNNSQLQCRFCFSWPVPLFLDYVIREFRGPLIHFLLIAQKLLLLFKLCNIALT